MFYGLHEVTIDDLVLHTCVGCEDGAAAAHLFDVTSNAVEINDPLDGRCIRYCCCVERGCAGADRSPLIDPLRDGGDGL